MSNNNQPSNLYDLLRRLQRDSDGVPGAITLTEAERQFIDIYLGQPEDQIHFKAHRVGGTDDNPVMAQSYAIAGDPEHIFCLPTEACLQNPAFASMVESAAVFMRDHVRNCPDCARAVLKARTQMIDSPSWEFKPHPEIKQQ